MRKWVRRYRTALVVASAAVIVAAFAVLVWRGAPWLDASRLKALTPVQRETAIDAIRGRMLTLGAGLLATAALVYTALNFRLSRESHVTDRYTKAIEQLGSDKLDVRIGGIYALERVARDSARDHPTVIEVLAAFIREHSNQQWPPSDPGGQEQERSTRADVQAAVTVVERRDAKRDIEPINLTGADLTDAHLDGAHLTRATLTRADLTGAHLTGADLRYANLRYANLINAILTDAHLDGAHLDGSTLNEADLTRAHLDDAHLDGAHLNEADLTRATLTRADLTGADLRYANLTRADLRYANLTGEDRPDADLIDFIDADLTGADLTDARWSGDAPVPEGWKLDTSSGRLERADTGSGPTEAN